MIPYGIVTLCVTEVMRCRSDKQWRHTAGDTRGVTLWAGDARRSHHDPSMQPLKRPSLLGSDTYMSATAPERSNTTHCPSQAFSAPQRNATGCFVPLRRLVQQLCSAATPPLLTGQRQTTSRTQHNPHNSSRSTVKPPAGRCLVTSYTHLGWCTVTSTALSVALSVKS